MTGNQSERASQTGLRNLLTSRTSARRPPSNLTGPFLEESSSFILVTSSSTILSFFDPVADVRAPSSQE